ncbi:MAG TPA: Fe-S cluster assembly protein SufD, partial [Actinomycetes bacterium]|nr:Fe-S cluster assembly protein SufD [Actinomycetes bacterium]
MPTGQKLPTVEVSRHSHGAGADGERAVSKLHAFASSDVADFPIPHGREEEWRFTPLNRLRGLHDGTAAPTGKVLVEVDAPAGVTVSTAERDDPRVGRAGVPPDRVAAAAWTFAESATVITVPAETAPDRPITVRLHGEAAQGAAYGHLV